VEPERWRQVERLYESALEQPESDRVAFLERVCADEELRREVASLLAHQDAAANFIEVPAMKIEPAFAARDQEAATQTVEDAADIIGHRFAHYRVINRLGGGGMGVVYTAEDVRLDRPVALKFLPERFRRDRAALERFRREARAASSLNHPNICTVFDIGEQDGRPFIVMERLEGQTLKHLIQGKPLPIDDVLKLGREILNVLEAAHAKGIVHRDIKPANIFVTNRGQAKVLDFGIAKLVADVESVDVTSASTAAVTGEHTLTQPGVALGTLSYMSPEQAHGKQVDARSDLFSFGAVLYEMATGKRAFPKSLDWTPSPAPHGLDRELHRIVLKLLEADPQVRYQRASDVLSDLERLQTRLQSAGSRRWWLIAAASMVAAVLTSVIFWPRADRGWQAVELTRVTSDSGLTAYPALSRDGKLLGYASDRGGGIMNIWVQQVAGGEPVRVTNGPADDTEPSFSPDGSVIAFRSERDGGGVYTVPALGGEPRRIANQGRRPRFSPDGQWIAYWVGERHQFARNQTYIVPSSGGEPRRLVSTFFSADDPLWSPDGQHVLFLGAEDDKKPVAERYDWWVTPVTGGAPVATGALAALRDKGVSPVWREPGDWLDDSVVFAASTGQYATVLSTGLINQSSIWSVRLASSPWRIDGEPQQLTIASGAEAQPSVTRGPDGVARLALTTASTPGNTHIWAIPVRANEGKVTGEMERLTSSVVENQYASISADGSTLVFSSDRQRNQDIVLKDLRSGTETVLTATEVNEFSPFLSTDSSKVLYYIFRPDRKPSFSFWVVKATGGVARQVCADCDGPLYGWSSDATKVIWRDQPADRPGRVRVRDVESGTDVVLLEHSRYGLTLPRLSPDDRWMLFQTVITQTQRQIFVAPVHGWQAAPESSWVSLTNGRTPDRNAVWAPDGTLVYFLSERDGFRCFWAQPLDPKTKRPEGEPFAVRHFHQARLSYDADTFAGIQLSIGADKLVFPNRERTGNIWLAKLESR
jgi:Tol biopolymer transport system component/tRNA A-37 threonylcarbamoyl transferase component Bud32